jgi:hypothetical protein
MVGGFLLATQTKTSVDVIPTGGVYLAVLDIRRLGVRQGDPRLTLVLRLPSRSHHNDVPTWFQNISLDLKLVSFLPEPSILLVVETELASFLGGCDTPLVVFVDHTFALLHALHAQQSFSFVVGDGRHRWAVLGTTETESHLQEVLQ